MGRNFILFGISLVFFLASLKNFKVKKDLEVPIVLERTKQIALGLLLFFLVMTAYLIEGNIFHYLLVFGTWTLILSLVSVGGFTKEMVYFYGGISIFLSKRRIEDLKYLKTVYIGRNKLAKTLLRGNLVKRHLFFESRYLTRIEKILKGHGVTYYGRYEDPVEKY